MRKKISNGSGRYGENIAAIGSALRYLENDFLDSNLYGCGKIKCTSSGIYAIIIRYYKLGMLFVLKLMEEKT